MLLYFGIEFTDLIALLNDLISGHNFFIEFLKFYFH